MPRIYITQNMICKMQNTKQDFSSGRADDIKRACLYCSKIEMDIIY